MTIPWCIEGESSIVDIRARPARGIWKSLEQREKVDWAWPADWIQSGLSESRGPYKENLVGSGAFELEEFRGGWEVRRVGL